MSVLHITKSWIRIILRRIHSKNYGSSIRMPLYIWDTNSQSALTHPYNPVGQNGDLLLLVTTFIDFM